MKAMQCISCGAPLKRGRRNCEYCETEYLNAIDFSLTEVVPDNAYKGWVFANAGYGIPQCGGGGGGSAYITIKY